MTGDSRLLERTDDQAKAVRFFPEGGYLVKGLPARVAWDCQGQRGILNIERMTDLRQVSIEVNGRKREAVLPEPQEEGCVLRLETTRADSVVLDVFNTSSLNGHTLAWALMHEGTVIGCQSFTTSGRYSVSLSRGAMPEGVSQITLLDSEGRILSERFLFIPPKSDTPVEVKTANKALTPCGRVTVDITAAPYTSLSLSATDAASAVNGRSGNIRTWMLLGSDLRGYIANPDYYFEADDEAHRKAADLLMLVQGWRRFDWDFITGRRNFDRPQVIEENLYLFGTVKPKKKKDPVEGVTVTATFIGDGEKFFLSAKTDSAGRYAMVLPDIQDEWVMNIMTTYEGKRTEHTVTIDRHFAPKARTVATMRRSSCPSTPPTSTIGTSPVRTPTSGSPSSWARTPPPSRRCASMHAARTTTTTTAPAPTRRKPYAKQCSTTTAKPRPKSWPIAARRFLQ